MNQMDPTRPLVSTRDLVLGYPGAAALTPKLNLHLPPGRLTVLLGPNGAGKTTLLRTLLALNPPLSGEVLLEGKSLNQWSLRARARRIAWVGPKPVSPPGMTVEEVVALGRHPHTTWSARLGERDRDQINKALHSLHLAAFAERDIATLSDGERQRVEIARALAQEASLVVLDEPTAFLDLPHRADILLHLSRLAHEGRSVLLSTHDVNLGLRLGDHLWLMGPGAWVEGSPEELAFGGNLEEAFSLPNARFDPRRGGVEVERRHRGTVALHGEGKAAYWVKHLLARLGLEVDQESAHSLRVAEDPLVIHWSLGDAQGEVTGLVPLEGMLRQYFPDP